MISVNRINLGAVSGRLNDAGLRPTEWSEGPPVVIEARKNRWYRPKPADNRTHGISDLPNKKSVLPVGISVVSRTRGRQRHCTFDPHLRSTPSQRAT